MEESRFANNHLSISFPSDWLTREKSPSDVWAAPPARATYQNGPSRYEAIPRVTVKVGVKREDLQSLSPNDYFTTVLRNCNAIKGYESVSTFEVAVVGGLIAYCHEYKWVDFQTRLQTILGLVMRGSVVYDISCSGTQGVDEEEAKYTCAYNSETFRNIIASFEAHDL